MATENREQGPHPLGSVELRVDILVLEGRMQTKKSLRS